MTGFILPSLEHLKIQAKRLRARLAEDGDFINHSEALEIIARQHGYKDWNTLHAAVGNRPEPPRVAVGARVSGRYLGQTFSGDVIGVSRLSHGRLRVTLDFDEPVDVVSFDSFSAFRKRVSCVVDEDGTSRERTSNGRPHIEINQ